MGRNIDGYPLILVYLGNLYYALSLLSNKESLNQFSNENLSREGKRWTTEAGEWVWDGEEQVLRGVRGDRSQPSVTAV